MNIAFPVLAGEIAKRGIKKSAISSALGISGRALYSKMSGETQFTWPEVNKIRHSFFPDISPDEPFATQKERDSA